MTSSLVHRTAAGGPSGPAKVVAPLVLLATLVLAACSSGTSGSTDATAPVPTPVPGSGASTGTTGRPGPPKPTKPTKVASPTVTGPITGGKYGRPFNTMPTVVADEHGYQEAEYFVAGTATSYRPEGTWTDDGEWTAVADRTAPFTTRIIVRLPRDRARFNGVVLTEWLNVSSGMDADPDFAFAHPELLRQGYGYIGVSAQWVGIEGGPTLVNVPGIELKALKPWDGERYAPLSHPGDEFSYDIFSQAAATTRDPGGVDPFAGYDVRHLLAAGESQSAFRMTTYVNAVHPLVRLFDGFLVHSRGPGGAPLSATNVPPVPKATGIRADITEPVFQLVTETDLFGLGFHPSRQPDTGLLRTWEIAGTAHADQHTLDAGIASGHEWDPKVQLDFRSLCGTINAGPQTFVARAAVAALRTWVVEGTAPPTADPLVVENGAIVRDADGNAKGGIRTAAVDAPISQLSGEPTGASSVICMLFGFTKPFTMDRLAALYPTHDEYVRKVTEATDRAIAAGFLLAADRAEILDAAEAAPVPT